MIILSSISWFIMDAIKINASTHRKQCIKGIKFHVPPPDLLDIWNHE
ncbi:hypothetical protein [Desulfocicer vacuolatum]|nr:hypothetical protein [Desulfocicer vacuolatum]